MGIANDMKRHWRELSIDFQLNTKFVRIHNRSFRNEHVMLSKGFIDELNAYAREMRSELNLVVGFAESIFNPKLFFINCLAVF